MHYGMFGTISIPGFHSLDDNSKIPVVIACVFRLCQMSPGRQGPSGLRIIDLESSDKVYDGQHGYK